MLARALLSGADVILADEPTADLDPDTGARIIAALRRRRAGPHGDRRHPRPGADGGHGPRRRRGRGAGMRVLWRLTRLLWQADPWAMWRGAAAALAVLVMGAALLGLSGWFITATGLAGLAGIGIAFDVFRPSAGVRFLALGRAGARYAERLLTHDATLRALARLRLTLMARLETWPMAALRRLRGASELTRITADVDALDGLILRLVLPLAAGLLTHAMALAALWVLVSGPVAVAVAGGYVLGGALVLTLVARRALRPSARAENLRQRHPPPGDRAAARPARRHRAGHPARPAARHRR